MASSPAAATLGLAARPMPTHLDGDVAWPRAIEQNAAAVLDDLAAGHAATDHALPRGAHDRFVLDEKADMKPVRVGVAGVFAPLQDEREAGAVGEDCDCGRLAVALHFEPEMALEKRDRTENVGDLQIQMIELHG